MAALDTSTDGGITNPGTSHTFSHTCTGSDLILFVGVMGDVTTDRITGVTYNGVAMTLIDKILEGDDFPRWAYLYYLIAPATGAHNVVISASASIALGGSASSYTGASQTGQPDASNKNSGSNVASGVDYTTSVTTIADNCWTVMFTKNDSGTATASTGSTLRTSNASGLSMWDSNGVISPAGARSMSVQRNATSDWASVIASFSPVATASARTSRLSLLGVS